MLKLAGETDIGLEKIEVVAYSPGLKDTGDLEAGTHSIVPTSRPAIAGAQYSASLTLPKPNDARLEVLNIGARLSVNIAGLGTATHVYCSVRVDVDDTDHELFNQDWTSTGAKLVSVSTNSGNKATIFNLLKDGAAHTFYFLFWADVASQASIDVVQLWEGVGVTNTTAYWGVEFLKITHTGLMRVAGYVDRVGTGTRLFIHASPSGSAAESCFHYQETGYVSWLYLVGLIIASPDYAMRIGNQSVATDLFYLSNVRFFLRSEQ